MKNPGNDEIGYQRGTYSGLTYKFGSANDIQRYTDDVVCNGDGNDLQRLSRSPNWQDRIRAEALRQRISSAITLTDGFPCIYEDPESPKRSNSIPTGPHPWVVSPDEVMLQELLPLYQELWDCYTAQRGPQSRRIMVFGHLDGLSPHGVYLPGVTKEQIIVRTIIMHSMNSRLTPKLKKIYSDSQDRP